MVQTDFAKENMKSNSFDYTYTNGNGIQAVSNNMATYTNEDFKLVEKVEVLIKALGTMVIINESVINPQTLKKEHIGAVQQPILLDEQRDQVLNKLTELIGKL